MSNLEKKLKDLDNAPTVIQPQNVDMSNPFSSLSNFEAAQRMASALSKSSLIPKEYQNNIPNCLIALEISLRLKASALMVMQNLYIVHGKPGWSAQYIIAAINSCGKFSPLRFKMDEKKTECTAYAIELDTNEVLEGAKITLEMARQEGWSTKSGSKWITMPEQMLRYRSASFFGKIYAPEILMGFQTTEEVEDSISYSQAKVVDSKPVVDLSSKLSEVVEPVATQANVVLDVVGTPVDLNPGSFSSFGK